MASWFLHILPGFLAVVCSKSCVWCLRVETDSRRRQGRIGALSEMWVRWLGTAHSQDSPEVEMKFLLLLEVTACFDIIPNLSTTMVALYYAHIYASIPLPNMTSF